ncbi:YaaC family protein [Virgibacillus sp. C22-A2]|uniref:YaaC family protein n=1 Tax=Virgibacillus tibetensis TaxID=3042313 RepID=A0ABU6KIP4_9BACI|nr:YaaC family protein [Virgibacillus sp. C22-A2]
MKEINDFYTFLKSQQTAQSYLQQCYENIEVVDAEAKSYKNCSAFIYYLDHGNRFYENGKRLDMFAQPVLYFYGMVHLLKACLLTKRPDYPESTSLLSHGVTARKRKRKNYTFMDDEVKVQQNGLFPYFSTHLFAKNKLPFEKVKMVDLFALIPEMNTLFDFQKKGKLIQVGVIHSKLLQFPSYLLDSHHLTANAFIQRIKVYLPEIKYTDIDNSAISMELMSPLTRVDGPFFKHKNGKIFFPIHRENFLPLSEVMVHYLLLYNLSMLCRYDAEWWGDLLVTKPDIDFPFIAQFIEQSAEKIPLLLGEEIFNSV